MYLKRQMTKIYVSSIVNVWMYVTCRLFVIDFNAVPNHLQVHYYVTGLEVHNSPGHSTI
jgi:hypothetical protein